MIISNQLARHPWVRWAIPVAVAAVAVGGTTLVSQLSADAAGQLPARSAAQLLVDVQSAADITGSGTVVQKADLGLPELPTLGGSGSSSLTSLISGNHTLRIWSGGATKSRIALMGTLGESDVIRNGRDLWTWSSDSNSATHVLLPVEQAKKSATDAASELGGAGSLTPQQLADQALAAIDPTTKVSTAGAARVAGRDAYELVLAPKDTASLVGQVRIAVDAEKYIPLRVQVFAKQATVPAAEVGFTQISFSTPSEAQFRFTPPPGVKLTEQSAPGTDQRSDQRSAAQKATGEPRVTGKGWTSVVQAQLPADAGQDQFGQILGMLPRKSGSWGTGRLLHSSLFNVLLTDDGRLLAGAVSAERLYELAGQPLPALSTAQPAK
jgi:outer membrane lipoprotein-sorting protein